MFVMFSGGQVISVLYVIEDVFPGFIRLLTVPWFQVFWFKVLLVHRRLGSGIILTGWCCQDLDGRQRPSKETGLQQLITIIIMVNSN